VQLTPSSTLSAPDLSRRVRAHGHELTHADAAAFLAEFTARGITTEVLPGRYRLTHKGRRLAARLEPTTTEHVEQFEEAA
jgi:hypothetical protein